MQKNIKSVEEMIQFGHSLSYINSYHKIMIHGDLGAGKTHLVKGWVKGIYDKKSEANGNLESENITNIYKSFNINSPTYTYYQIYGKVLHLDMYRLESYSDLISKGILDQIMDHDFVAIEWPKYLDSYEDKSRKHIYISKIDDNNRYIEIK